MASHRLAVCAMERGHASPFTNQKAARYCIVLRVQVERAVVAVGHQELSLVKESEHFSCVGVSAWGSFKARPEFSHE